MSEIYIHYGNLEDAISISKRVRDGINDYVGEIQNKVNNSISRLPGNDSAGYASTASSLALQKITDLNQKASRFSAFEASASSLISVAKEKDGYVSKRIDEISGMYIEKRNWFQSAGDWLYKTFCVDVANNWDWTRNFADHARVILDKFGNAIDNTLGEVVDWFKYGDGQYVWNITTSVVGAVVAVGGAFAAICSIPFTGGATIPIVIGCIGAAAASVGAIITVANSIASASNNFRALSYVGNPLDSNDGDPSAARYYGSTSKVSDAFEKKDFGSKEINQAFDVTGDAIDTTKTVADVVSLVCNIAKLGNVNDFRYTKNPHEGVKGYDFSIDNIKRNLAHEMGFKVTSKDLKDDSFNITDSIFAKSYTQEKKFTLKWNGGKLKVRNLPLVWDKGTWSVNEKAVKVFKGAKIVDNLIDLSENLDSFNEQFVYRNDNSPFNNVSGIIDSTVEIAGHSDFFSILDDYGAKTMKTIPKIYDLFAH